VPTAAQPNREFCASCGFPLRARRCDVCGGDAEPLALQEGRRAEPSASLDDGAGGLERAYEAFHNRDFGRFIGQVVAAEGGATARAVPGPDGPGWIAVVRGALVFVALHAVSGDLSLQAPVVRLSRAQRLPVLRLALELSAQEAPTARFCLRDDLLVLRFGAAVDALTPPSLQRLLREIGHLAARYAEIFAVSFEARPAVAEADRASAGFDALGQVRKLRLGSGAIRSIPPPAPSRSSQPELSEPAPARRSDAAVATTPRSRLNSQGGMPPIPRRDMDSEPPKPPSASSAALGKAGYGQGSDPGEPIPAILAPMFAAGPEATSSANKPRVGAASAPGRPAIPPLPPAPSIPAPSKSRPIVPEIEIEAPSRRPSVALTVPTGEAPLPAERLCNLLRQAKSLAALVLDARPASMPWLVRAAVFRAVHEYRDALPDSVAHLYRCTGLGREPGEPALMVIERVIVARGQVAPEKPFSVDPLTTATQAKEHIGRYLQEIERTPAEPPLRHFLAMGALAELLARAKLPTQTETRLRDIVTHAQREGAKTSTIDLMMTALQRIAGG
jgi:hypothetical protein